MTTTTPARTEFSVAGQPEYDRRGPVRWIVSHQLRNPWHLAGFLIGSVAMVVLNSMVPGLVGDAFDAVLDESADRRAELATIAVVLLVVVVGRTVLDFVARLCTEVLAKRIERDARDELYVSLLGKSQTFHNRQRVGDLMARGANDVRQLGTMFSPGIDLLVDSLTQGIVPIVFIAFLDPRLLVAPLIFAVAFVWSIRRFMRRLSPVSASLREHYGTLNAGLNETIRGIEVVKATGQEEQELGKFSRNARRYRDAYVEQGLIQARYLPTLLLSIATAGGLLHGLWLLDAGELSVGGLITYIGLLGLLGFPAFISIFSFSLVQNGIASANRLLALMREETELDHNEAGHVAPMRGAVEFQDVTFTYGGQPVLEHLSFRIEPGQTVAIVGETGAGKTTLTKLVNRIYDVTSGRILVDGVDVREWNLDSLRSQISTIEQDIVLFSRPVHENIAFSLGQQASRDDVVRAAKDAQAHEFVTALDDGYDTVIGERGVTLSGGQRQRLAIARALLTDPAILVLDDSTSAIDSATEDEIQRAIQRVLEGRTTLLITHRLSQIRWADKVLLLQRGRLVDEGSHDELLGRCALYRRIFAHYDEAFDGGDGKAAG
ncbi:ABC transporter ATP-binding protein [Jiangella rhizosphaerae]|uniref:ABC transporter ATP-binding protein n=1 Tax=Jiangella rhizosphaerae TaxID=2293569 RepID=A0A418KV45_9ACTN|nr:ABC transporter ATP-binding protein [Jiangella rhizosphaerae]RIQ33648.1 ABC transporter ATP-binding protein [Jiangella rhizosphaerae]